MFSNARAPGRAANPQPHAAAGKTVAPATPAPHHALVDLRDGVVQRKIVSVIIDGDTFYYDDEDPDRTAWETEADAQHYADVNRENWHEVVDALEHVATLSEKLALELPPLVVDEAHADEAERQLMLQLEGLQALSAAEWLANLLMNRMKSTEQQIAEGFGTAGGKKLARKIDDLLISNNDVGRFLLRSIAQRMRPLLAHRSREAAALAGQIYDMTQVAIHSDAPYMEFRFLGGVQALEKLSAAGIGGGIGRQHGEGDEKAFRTENAAGIELLKTSAPGRFERNACLHNPDQCVGGPVEILWHAAQREELVRKRTWAENAARNFVRTFYLCQSYEKTPIRTRTGEVDAAAMERAEEQLSIEADEFEQALAEYLHELSRHVGNYDVNSLLGKTWMEETSELGAINRIDMILEYVAKIPFDELESTPLNVVMAVHGAPSSTPSLALLETFPDIEKVGKLEFSSSSAPKASTVDARIDRKAEKLAKPQQKTLEDLEYSKARKKLIAAPHDLVAQAQAATGLTLRRSGVSGLNCYIYSIATWLQLSGYIPAEAYQDAVANISGALAGAGLRFEGQMIDAGGVAAARVQQLVNNFATAQGHAGVQVSIRIVQWDYYRGGVTQFDANAGNQVITFLYTPGHFDLLF